MRDSKPGDVSARIGFSRVLGVGPDAGNIRPNIEISCNTSGLVLRLELTPKQLAEMLGGGEAYVTADKITGFQYLKNWGRYLEVDSRMIPAQPGDYQHNGNPSDLPHISPVVEELEEAGYQVGLPRRNNAGKWFVVGRRYTDTPPS